MVGGLVPNLTYDEYAAREGVSASILKLVALESLATVKATLDGRISRESDALDFGKAWHALLLEGKTQYVVQPATYESATVKKGEDPIKPWNNNSKTCKAWYAAQTVPILTEKDIVDLHGMVAAVRRNEELAPYLNGQSELSAFASFSAGQKLKARFDLLPDDASGPVIDFKKACSANPSKFVKQIFDLKYYIQAAVYLDVLKLLGKPRKQFWFVAVEDFAPYNLYISKLIDQPISFIELGRREYRGAYRTLESARSTNYWPSYGSSEAEAHVTSWMQQAIEATA
jgi:hypothetical protein